MFTAGVNFTAVDEFKATSACVVAIKCIISLLVFNFGGESSKAENRVTKPPIDKLCMQAYSMSNKGSNLRIGYNVDMEFFLVFGSPIIIVVLLAMWMFENVE